MKGSGLINYPLYGEHLKIRCLVLSWKILSEITYNFIAVLMLHEEQIRL